MYKLFQNVNMEEEEGPKPKLWLVNIHGLGLCIRKGKEGIPKGEIDFFLFSNTKVLRYWEYNFKIKLDMPKFDDAPENK